MAKAHTPANALDKEYAERMLREFFKAVKANDAEQAEDFYNEITGTLCSMMERIV